jgi:hypothetical protein
MKSKYLKIAGGSRFRMAMRVLFGGTLPERSDIIKKNGDLLINVVEALVESDEERIKSVALIRQGVVWANLGISKEVLDTPDVKVKLRAEISATGFDNDKKKLLASDVAGEEADDEDE